VFDNVDVIHALLIIDGNQVTNGDKWTIGYSLQTKAEDDDVDEKMIPLFFTVIPGVILFLGAFIVFELPYLLKKRAQKAKQNYE
jgi:hypothetical protein